MLLIFEGPDGAGKSTLIQQLQERLGNTPRVFHSTPPRRGADKALEFLVPLMSRQEAWLDRSWYSELIYGSVMRGRSLIDVPRRRVLERLYLSAGAVQIWCLPSYHVCAQAWRARQATEHVQDETQFKRIYDLYVEHGREPRLPTIRYDYRTCSVEAMVERLLNLPSLMGGPGVGAWSPGRSILLVGEQPNLHRQRYLGPFCSWSKTGCSAWLAQQLEAVGVHEQSLYWVNAIDEHDEPLDPGFLKHLRPRSVIALGKVAARWCEYEAGLPFFHAVPHPQHWKRFHAKKPYPLIKELLSLTEVQHARTPSAPALVF